MKVDLEARTISVSVRELSMRQERAFVSAPARWRAKLGARAHADYGATLPDGAETEVALALERTVDGFTATVRGRADVVKRGGDADDVVLIEEVKSVIAAPGEDAIARAMFQACIYALALESRDGRPARAVVVLYSLIDGTTRVLDAGYARPDTESRVDAVLSALIAGAMADGERRARRVAAAAELAFPYAEPRPHQRELMAVFDEALESGRPALAAAPTGIGKTICALLPALRHALRHGAVVFYATAKTTQRALVGETFTAIERASRSRHRLRALTLRSRQEMCPPGHLMCHPKRCPLLADFDERCDESVISGLLEEPHVEPARVFERGRELSLCPYELSMRAAEQVDVLIGDFNHAFSAGAMPSALGGSERVVVIDEAHNLFDRARGYFSPFVGQRDAEAAKTGCLLVEPPALAACIAGWCDAVIDELAHAPASPEPHEEAQPVDGCRPALLDAATWRRLAEEGELLGARHAEERYLRGNVLPDDRVLELVERVSQLAELLQGAHLLSGTERDLVSYVADGDAPSGPGVGLVCVDPARRLERVHRQAIGTLAMSATLSPLSYFSDVLGLSRLAPIVTSAPSPFPAEQRLVRIAPQVSTTLRERDAHAPAVARIIETVYNARAGRYIAFFSSFAYATTVRQHLAVPRDELLVQLPATITAAREHMLRQLQRRPRALLLAVMGGVFGEGVDLPGDALIGAIVVGPALPPVSFERLAMRHHFEEEHEHGFAYAMVYPGLQRVIQAAGRVIRTPEDTGVIVLADRRFAEPDYADCLPDHWYRHSPEELVTHDLAGDLAAFWAGSVS